MSANDLRPPIKLRKVPKGSPKVSVSFFQHDLDKIAQYALKHHLSLSFAVNRLAMKGLDKA